jgi:hypothetical protein
MSDAPSDLWNDLFGDLEEDNWELVGAPEPETKG